MISLSRSPSRLASLSWHRFSFSVSIGTWFRLAYLTLLFGWFMGYCSVTGAQQRPVCGEAFWRELERPAAILWSQVPWGEAIESLRTTRNLTIWLDRRLVTTELVTLNARSDTLLSLLVTMGEELGIDVAWVDCVIYIGPPGGSNRWATASEVQSQMVQKLPAAQKKIWQQRRDVKWDTGTSPQSLLDQWQQETQLTLTGKELVPHDAWKSGSFSQLTYAQRLGLILVGFDLTYVIRQDGSIHIVPLPESPKVTKTYRVRAELLPKLASIHEQFPAGKLDVGKEHVRVTGSWQFQEEVRQLIRPPRPSERNTGTAKQARYSLRSENQPIGPLLENLATQFGLRCTFSEAAREKWGERVTFEHEKLERDELMRRIVAPLGLRCTFDNDELHVDLAQDRS